MKRFLLLSLVIVASTFCSVLFAQSSVKATSIYDNSYQTTDTIEVNRSTCSPIDITADWAIRIRDASRYSGAPWTSLENALDHGRWGVTQFDDGSSKTVWVYWTEDDSLYLDWDDDSTYVFAKGTGVKRAILDTTNHSGSTDCDNVNIIDHDTSGGPVPVSDATRLFTNLFVYTDHINYPPDYGGTDVRGNTVLEPDFTVHYSFIDKALKIKDTTVYPSEPDECWFQLANNLYGDDFTEYYFDCELQPEIEHTFPEYNTYGAILFARFGDQTFSHTFPINIDGRTYDSELGYSGSCDTLEGFFESIQCDVRNQLSLGVINPSITAFKGLLTSMVVDEPSCSLTFPDISLGGSTYPSSDYPEQICDRSDQFRDSFPITTALVNGVMALQLLYLVAAIINRFLNPNEARVIEGVTK